MTRGRAALALALAASTALAVGLTAVPAAAAGDELVITGHGYGHGRGMGQYGALGYATDYGWDYNQILAHYYGGTTLTGSTGNPVIRVELTASTGSDLIVRGTGLVLNGTPTSASAVLVRRTGPQTFSTWTGRDCSGPWEPGATFTVPDSDGVIVGSTADTSVGTSMLQVCTGSGSTSYRGELQAVFSGDTQYAFNRVRVEDYLRGVVPRESPASWGSIPGGMEALKAQAVVARSYARASSRASGATTCDTTACQVYGGAGSWSGGVWSSKEAANSDEAVRVTAEQVLMSGAAIARTEFSSSTGGWTAGGAFPAVVDEGDATSRNPNHDWSVTTTLSAAASALQTGPLASIAVTGRNGLGADGGRVTQVTATTTAGTTVTFSGATVRSKLGLKSDWFSFPTQPPVQFCSEPGGYWLVGADGGVFAFCGAGFFGSTGGLVLNRPVVAVAARPQDDGYWLVASDGGVFAFGDAAFYGSTGAMVLNRPIVAAMATPSGGGYWLVASDGGVFAFGDAAFYGSTGAMVLNRPIVAAMATPSGGGYWLVASDGGVFAFGDAAFYGSTGAMVLNRPIVAAMATPSGGGYWLMASDGGVFAFGDAGFHGSTGAIALNQPIVAAAAGGAGYWMFARDGGVFAFDAPYLGSLGGRALNSPIVGAAAA